jgi:hypothetical protein
VNKKTSRHADAVNNLRRAVLESPGATTPGARVAAATGLGLEGPWAVYVAQVRDQPYRIVDKDIDGLLAAGCSQDEIFEMTVAAALGAALRRLDAGLRAVSTRA